MDCRGIWALMPKAPLPPPFFTDLGVFAAVSRAPSEIQCLAVSPSWLRCSGLFCGVSIGAGWKQLCPAWGSPGLCTHRPPCRHPVPTSCHLHQLFHSGSFFSEHLEMWGETVSGEKRCSCLNPPSHLQMESLPEGEVLEIESSFLSLPGWLLLMKPLPLER